jgi:hypothetical protein
MVQSRPAAGAVQVIAVVVGVERQTSVACQSPGGADHVDVPRLETPAGTLREPAGVCHRVAGIHASVTGLPGARPGDSSAAYRAAPHMQGIATCAAAA